MKLTLIRTDKKNRHHLSTCTMEALTERMKSENKDAVVSALRRELPMMQAYGMKFAQLHKLPRVYVASSLGKDERNEVAFRQPTGLLLLTA